VQLLENKEDMFISLITPKLEQYGYTIAPTPYQPAIPQAAAESNAQAATAAAEALAQAHDRAAEAQEVYQYALGQPGEAGAAARLTEAEAAVTAAQKLVDEIQAVAVAAAEAATVTAPLLQQYDVVVWKPKKKMTVCCSYSCTYWPCECQKSTREPEAHWEIATHTAIGCRLRA
jgi:hypothetical protein